MGAGCSRDQDVHSPGSPIGQRSSINPGAAVAEEKLKDAGPDPNTNTRPSPLSSAVTAGSIGLTTVPSNGHPPEAAPSPVPLPLVAPSTSGRSNSVHFGAPAPADEAERMATLNSLGVLGTEPERRFDDITKLCCKIFKVPICLVSLVDVERQWFKSVQGLPNNETPRTSSFCAWTLLPACPEVLVVENALLDVRFQNNPLVVGFPHIRFYAGAPLVASDGKRLGSLCIIDNQSRTFDADSGMMLANFGEMIMRELERDRMLEMQRRQSLALTQEKSQLLRAIDCFSEAIMLCDVQDPAWPMLFMNESWGVVTGIDRDQAASIGFWDAFKVQGKEDKVAKTREAYEEAISEQQTFKLVVTSQLPGSEGATFTLQFRSANNGNLDAQMPLIGIPSTVRDPGSGAILDGRCYYYATVVKGAASGPGMIVRPSSATSGITGSSAKLFTLVNEKVDPFTDVKLGALLGCGAFGRVYRGQWNNANVAVKVLEHHEGVEQMEALLSSQISHPNVVQTFKHCCRAMPSANEHSQRLCETWIVLEFCNKGTLTDAVDRGWFRERGSLFDVDYGIMLHTAKEICSAMAYMHGCNILHGDLTGQNVLLNASEGLNGRDFTVKVADFGFSRVCEATTVKTKTHGSISHTPPELLLDGVLSKSADVHAFGMLLWEMFMGQRPFMGMSQAQIIHHISSRRQLAVSDACPPCLRKLIASCCNINYEQRPTFAQLLTELDDLVDELT